MKCQPASFMRLPVGAQPMVVDGKMDENWWAQIAGNSQFWEHTPGDRLPPKVQTEVKMAYDAQFLYVAVTSFDPKISQIRAPHGRRDETSDAQDGIAL